MGDMTESIAPRSDQMNAEDLLSGPRTFTINRVRVTETPDQPVHVYLNDFPADRPFKPSKTVRRLMVVAWGPDSAAYVGKRMTLYRDPAVRFGGMDVGGIRVSHMSGLAGPLNVALAVTRGRRAPYTVDPLPDGPPAARQQQPLPLPARVERMLAGFASLAVTEDDLSRRIGRPRAGWAEDDLSRMTEVYVAMSRGALTREEAFPRVEVTADDLPPDPVAEIMGAVPVNPGNPPAPVPPEPAADGADPVRTDHARGITQPQTRKLHAIFGDLKLGAADQREQRLAILAALIDRAVGSSNDLSLDEAKVCLDFLEPVSQSNPDDQDTTLGGLVVEGQKLQANHATNERN